LSEKNTQVKEKLIKTINTKGMKQYTIIAAAIAIILVVSLFFALVLYLPKSSSGTTFMKPNEGKVLNNKTSIDRREKKSSNGEVEQKVSTGEGNLVQEVTVGR